MNETFEIFVVDELVLIPHRVGLQTPSSGTSSIVVPVATITSSETWR